MKFLAVSIGMLFALYLLGGILLFIFQRNFIYFPPAISLTPEGAGVPEMVVEQSQFDSFISQYWVSPPEAGQPIIAFFHGNASSLSDLAPLYREMIDRGYGAIAIAYPGYPGGSGFMNETEMTLSSRLQVQAVAKAYPESPVVVYGTSLGAAVASHVAAEIDVDLIILDAPFDSLTNRAQASTPFYPAALLLRDKWDNVKALEKTDAPLIWIHGSADNVIPLSFGQALFDSYDGPKSAHIIENGQHNDLWFRGGREITLKALEDLK